MKKFFALLLLLSSCLNRGEPDCTKDPSASGCQVNCLEDPLNLLCDNPCVDFPQLFPVCSDCVQHPESTFCDCSLGLTDDCCDRDPDDPVCPAILDNPHPDRGGPGDAGLPCADHEFCGTTATPDGFDNDCNGLPDDGCACSFTASDTLACYTGPAGTRGVGACQDGLALCEGVAPDGGETWGACVGQVLPLPNDDCGDVNTPPSDTNCNGIAGDGCSSLLVACPAEIFAAPLQTRTLTATATSSNTITSTVWELTARPIGSAASPTTPSSLASTLLVDLAGDYVMTFTAQDSAGQIASCSTVLHATQTENLRMELSWNNAADIDLHLLHPTATQWEDPLLDCNVFGCAPWPGTGTGDDPRIDISDADGFGPENINIDFPEVNAGAYRLGAYNFSDHGAGPSDLTVRVFCGGVLKAQLTHNDLLGPTQGGLPNQLWKITDILFNSQTTCTVVPLDAIVTMAHPAGAPR